MDNFRRREFSAGGVSPDGITYEYVDMGLSVKWATFDIGATAVGEYGKYFQWGDVQGYTKDEVGKTEGKKLFSWTDYKYCNGSAVTLTKYNSDENYGTVDYEGRLEPMDDAATFNMGEGWRTPTSLEYTELINACNQTWDRTNKWRIFTLKTDSTKKLVFPASGYILGSKVSYQGSEGHFWLSSIYTPPTSASSFYHNIGGSTASNRNRCEGLCVRGVYSPS